MSSDGVSPRLQSRPQFQESLRERPNIRPLLVTFGKCRCRRSLCVVPPDNGLRSVVKRLVGIRFCSVPAATLRVCGRLRSAPWRGDGRLCLHLSRIAHPSQRILILSCSAEAQGQAVGVSGASGSGAGPRAMGMHSTWQDDGGFVHLRALRCCSGQAAAPAQHLPAVHCQPACRRRQLTALQALCPERLHHVELTRK